MNLFLMRANRLSTKKRGLKTNHKDVLTAGEQESNRETTMATMAVTEALAAVADGKIKES
jgi:hypothetical protein